VFYELDRGLILRNESLFANQVMTYLFSGGGV